MTTTPAQPVAARYLGQSVSRKEDQRLLTGHGLYVDDVKVHGLLHAAFLRSDLARAAITHLDTSAAKTMPGVVAVYTWEDFNGLTGPAYHAMLGEELVVPPPLAITDVRYVGDPIALVVAESRYLAEDACEAIEVDYDPQPPVVDYRSAAADTDNIVHAGWGLESNAMASVPFMALSPDLDDAFAAARARRRVRRRAEPLRGDADGDARDHGVVPRRPRRARHRVRDPVGARDPQLLLPLPRRARQQRAGHRARCRRRFRSEDVRVPRGVRGGTGVEAAQPTGEVDRGPP